MRLGQLRERGRDAVELDEDQVECSSCDEHRGGVHDVLARGAPVDVACGVSADGVSQSLHERLRGASDGAPALEQIVEVVQISVALLRDRGGGVFGDDPGRRLCPGERGLELEHRLEPRPPRDGVEQLLRDEERPERRHTAKNVVSASPWRWMSKRRPSILGLRDQGRPFRLAELGEHRVRGVRLRLVGEVEPRHEVLEQPPGEHEDDEVRRLQPAVRRRALDPA